MVSDVAFINDRLFGMASWNLSATEFGENIPLRSVVLDNRTDHINETYVFITTTLPQNGTEERYTVTESVLLGLFLGFIIFAAVVGNVLVCVAVFTDRTLKRVSNYFIVSLAIADLMVSLVVMTFAVVNDISGNWHFGSLFCSIWISSDVMCSTASILNLCAISLDRYIHIRDPYRYERCMTARKAVLVIVFVWACSALISFLPIHLDWHNAGKELTNTTYTTVPDQSVCMLELTPVYAVVSSTISFYIPCIVMLALYARLYLYARKHVQNIKKTTFAPDRAYGATPGGGSMKGGYKVSDHKARVTLGVIMGVFLFCWSPFFMVNIIAAFCPSCIPPLLFLALTWLGYVNSALNPVIYSIFNQEFRQAFRKILFQRFFCRAPTDNIRYSIPNPGWRKNKTKGRADSKDSSNSVNAIIKPENGETLSISNALSKDTRVSQKVTCV